MTFSLADFLEARGFNSSFAAEVDNACARNYQPYSDSEYSEEGERLSAIFEGGRVSLSDIDQFIVLFPGLVRRPVMLQARMHARGALSIAEFLSQLALVEKLETCETCENLKSTKTVGGFPVFGCKITELVIPHGSTRNERDTAYVTTFYRVPMHCPLSDDLVIKRERNGTAGFVLCQDCLRVLPFTKGRHNGLINCECGGDLCGCSSCSDSVSRLQKGELSAKKLGLTGGDLTSWTPEKGGCH